MKNCQLILRRDANWNNLKTLDMCDYIVIGSGCTALAFIEEALTLDPYKKILCLERGGTLFPLLMYSFLR
jgi:hypothetical protein